MFKKERITTIAGGAATFTVWLVVGLCTLISGKISRFVYALVWGQLLTFIFLYYRRVWLSWKVLEDDIENKRKVINALEVMQAKLEVIKEAKEEQAAQE